MRIVFEREWRLLGLVAALTMPSALFAQVPTVAAVSNLGGRGLAPGMLAAISGTNFVGAISVFVGGRPAAVLEVSSPARLLVQLPVELTPGPASVVVTAGGGSSAALPVVLEAYAPALTGFGVSCNLDGTGDPTPIGTAVAFGLGATDPPVPTGQTPPPTTLAHTLVTPTVTIGGHPAPVIASVLVSWYPGTYQVSFRLPAGLRDGTYPGVLSVLGAASDTRSLELNTTTTHRSAAGSSAAGFQVRVGAPASLATATHCGGFGTETLSGDARTPPTTLGGTTVTITDYAEVKYAAPLLYVSASQVNYLIPSTLSNGPATVAITAPNGAVLTGTLNIQPIAPAVFQFPYDAVPADRPRPAALLVRGGGVPRVEPLTGPIDIGSDANEVYLVLFGTGLRFRSALTAVRVSIGGVDAPVEYAGPQNEFPGLDQVNVRVPRSLAGRGTVAVQLTVDGMAGNETYVTFQ
jgi:uncharacterized protein (TIGR03437 family)